MAPPALSKEQAEFFTTVYRLAQQSVEGFTLWTCLLDPFRTELLKGKQLVISTDEELLRIIITNTKRSFVITTYILCDNEGAGAKGLNVYKLIQQAGEIASDFDSSAELSLLDSSANRQIIKKLRILRNNLDAHHSDSNDWKKAIGEIENAQLEYLIHELYNIVCRCHTCVGLDRLSLKGLTKRTTTYGDRLLRALVHQAESNLVGEEFVPVEAWEKGDRYDSIEDLESWAEKRARKQS